MSELTQTETNSNPLKKYYRQPKQFIKLPSNYLFYSEGAIEVPESEEVAVYPMTAKDELIFKTPDALLNGEATVRVIESCIPAVKNGWGMPSLDIDACLIAIRMATYGTRMTVTINVPNTQIQKDYDLDLQVTLNRLLNAKYSDTIVFENFEIKTKPLNYKEFTAVALKSFEEQRLQAVLTNRGFTEEQKLTEFQKSFSKLTDLNIGMIVDTITSIRVDGNVVTDKIMIKEFIDNTSKEFYGAILDHLERQREEFSLPPVVLTATEEEKTAGAPDTYQVPITFDTANFFV
jgi:hypothetical protein